MAHSQGMHPALTPRDPLTFCLLVSFIQALSSWTNEWKEGKGWRQGIKCVTKMYFQYITPITWVIFIGTPGARWTSSLLLLPSYYLYWYGWEMLGTPILLPMSLVTLDNIYFCHLLHIQHHKQLWQWLWMSLAILAPRELKISQFIASLKSDYGSSVSNTWVTTLLWQALWHWGIVLTILGFGKKVASWETPLAINTQQGMRYGLRAPCGIKSRFWQHRTHTWELTVKVLDLKQANSPG